MSATDHAAQQRRSTPASTPWYARYPMLSAFAVAFLLYAIPLRSYHWLPAFHDAALHWEIAGTFFARPWFPFVLASDTGHPPLISWILAALWHLPLPRLLSMHLLSWAAAALLCAALFDLTRRTLGLFPALCAVALLGLHPVVIAQSLQLNLDLFQVAFAWTAVAGMVRGQPWLVAVALSASSMTKLNGPFAVPPVALWILLRLIQTRQLSDLRRAAWAFWPVAVPTAVFIGYHVIKYRLTGHFLVGPEFRDENLGHVRSLAEYAGRLAHSLYQLAAFPNPNALSCVVIAALLGCIALRWRDPSYAPRVRAELASTAPQTLATGAPRQPPAGDAQPFFRPLSVGQTLLLAWLVASCHILFWTLRQYFGLVRHMMGAYPAIALTVVLLSGLAFQQARRRGLALIMLPSLALSFFTLHPARVQFLPPPFAERLHFPHTDVKTNHENNLEVVDEMIAVRDAVAAIEQHFGPHVTVQTGWPFGLFFTDPTSGMSRSPLRLATHDADVIFLPGSWSDGPDTAVPQPPPGYSVFAIHRSGRIQDVTLARR